MKERGNVKYQTRPKTTRGLSNLLILILNALTFILSIPIITIGAKPGGNDCYRFLQKPVIVVGAFMMLMSILGVVAAAARNKILLQIYLVIMLLLMVLLFIFTIFAFVVTNKTAGDVVGNKSYKEYRLGDYSTWLQGQLKKSSIWDNVEKCISEGGFCSKLADDYPVSKYSNVTSFGQADISPIQSGCCIPPSACGCTYVTATFWSPCSNTTTATDCGTYSTDQSKLCYGCDSCKAGLLENITKAWRKIAIANIVVLVFLLIVYSVGCSAVRKAAIDAERKKPYLLGEMRTVETFEVPQARRLQQAARR